MFEDPVEVMGDSSVDPRSSDKSTIWSAKGDYANKKILSMPFLRSQDYQRPTAVSLARVLIWFSSGTDMFLIEFHRLVNGSSGAFRQRNDRNFQLLQDVTAIVRPRWKATTIMFYTWYIPEQKCFKKENCIGELTDACLPPTCHPTSLVIKGKISIRCNNFLVKRQTDRSNATYKENICVLLSQGKKNEKSEIRMSWHCQLALACTGVEVLNLTRNIKSTRIV